MTQHTIPMPKPSFTYERHPGGFCEPERVGAYTAEQMEAYAAAALEAQAAQIEALRADALRYRWLRDEAVKSSDVTSPFICGAGDRGLFGNHCDKAIDAAMAAKEPK